MINTKIFNLIQFYVNEVCYLYILSLSSVDFNFFLTFDFVYN